jgi:hypothetical protein
MKNNEINQNVSTDSNVLVSGSNNWNTTDYTTEKVKRIMDYTDWKFNHYYR